MPSMHIGCSAFTAAGFVGSLYPTGAKPAKFLSLYAEKFSSVEIDSSYYAAPSVGTVEGWYRRTPPGFLFPLKTPKAITDEAALHNVEDEMRRFVKTCQPLREKLGVILIQLPYFNRSRFKTEADFHERLIPFLKPLGAMNVKFALEIRNKNWLNGTLANMLRDHGVALVLQDILYMPRPWELAFDAITADFTYCRLLGDRKGIEQITKTWDSIVEDRHDSMREWVRFLKTKLRDATKVWMNLNSHYEGSSF